MEKKRSLLGTEILPLYARLSAAEQHRVFAPHAGRRVVLATNVAETSLTVPGIKYVVDPGTARISRYSSRLKVQRLPIEPVSQASANQRKGRCGRTSDGICIRLYDEQDFLSRPEFTDPEILRTNLASVILQMTAIGLGDIAAFPFIDPPDRRNVTDGVNLLHELGALDPTETDPAKRLTPLGRRLAQLPVDPRLARMVLEGERNGCATEVVVIAAALSIQDPRERPAEKQAQADQAHARFADKESDFVALPQPLALPARAAAGAVVQRVPPDVQGGVPELPAGPRVAGHRQPVAPGAAYPGTGRRRARPARRGGGHGGRRPARPGRGPAGGDRHPEGAPVAAARPAVARRAQGRAEARVPGRAGAKFALFPGSALFKKPPRWVMAAELVETSRLWGRVAGRVEPEWVEPLAQHLVKRSYSEPHWEKKQAAVMAYEKVTLYGIPLVTSRKVNFGRIDPALSPGAVHPARPGRGRLADPPPVLAATTSGC